MLNIVNIEKLFSHNIVNHYTKENPGSSESI